MAVTTKDEFENASKGKLGVVLINPTDNKPRAAVVEPGDSVWLSEDEQILTANAPKKPENNPFTNGSLILKTEAQEIGNRRPIGRTIATPPETAGEREAPAEVEPGPEPPPEPVPEPTPPPESEDLPPAAETASETETAAAPTPEAPPVEGERAEHEEVGTEVEPSQQGAAPTARNTVKAGPPDAEPVPQGPDGVPEPEKAPDPVVRG